MDRSVATGVVGTIFTFSMESVHLVTASICAVLVSTHAVYSIYLKYKNKDSD